MTRNLILWDMISLDGYFEGPNGGRGARRRSQQLDSGLVILRYRP